MSEHASTSTRQAIEWRFDPISGEPLSAHLVPAKPLSTTPQPLGYIPTDAIDQIKTPPRLITHKVPVLSYAAEGYTAIYTRPAAQAGRTTADTLREIKAASCKDCGASGYTDPGEADSPDGPGRPAVVCGACMGTGWRDGVHISDQQATPACADDMKVYDGMAAGYFADARQATPEPVQPFFVRDVAALLGVSVPDVCKALAHLGHGQRSTNMVISPDEALAVAEHIRPATPEPVGEATVNWFGTHFTYKNQPCDNVTAWRFGEAAMTAKPGGDLIDRGLSLLHELEKRGYGIYVLAAAQAKEGGA